MTDLGICYAQPFWFDGETYSTNDTSIIFPLHVGRDYFDQIHLFVPYKEADTNRGPLALSLGTDDSLIPGLDPGQVTVHPLPFKSSTREWYTVSAARDIVSAIRTLRRGLPKCGLVWMPAPPHVPTILCYIVCRMGSIPSFLYIRSDQQQEITAQKFSGLLSIKRLLGGQVLPGIERHIVRQVPTFVTGPGLRRKYEQDDKNIHTIRSIHLSEKHVIETHNTETRDSLRILYVGRLVPIKGVNNLINAVKVVTKRGYEVTLDVVGTGKQEAKLRNQAHKSSISNRVTFHGFVPFGPELFKLYRQAFVFILPSYSEGFPNVLLEAMANGSPVISSDVSGIDDVVIDGKNGLLVPPGDVDAIADAIIRLAQDKSLYQRIVSAGTETVKKYTVEQQETKLIHILRTEFPHVL